MWVMGNEGRYLEHRGRYLAAQQPRTIRWGHGLKGLGGMEATVRAIWRITVSASLSI